MRLKRLGKSYQTLAVLFLNTLILLLVIELTACLLLTWLDRRNENELVQQRISHSYYASQPWAETYWREHYQLQDRYHSYTVWRTAPFVGETITIDVQGYRVTPGAECDTAAYTVFVFGGSAVWGHGSPDWGTIPAYVQQELAAETVRPVCVRNFGEKAYVSTQGLVELERALQRGDVPDLVIFYDGVNDVAATYQNGRAGAHLNEPIITAQFTAGQTMADLLEQTHTYQLLVRAATKTGLLWPAITAEPAHEDTAVLTEMVLQAYFTNYQIVAALAGQYGFAYQFFWQPMMSAEVWQTSGFSEKSDLSVALLDELYRQVYSQIAEQAGAYPCLADLSHLFDKQSESVWIDRMHVTPPGNQTIAQAITVALQEDDSACHANP
jgi:lysophospholipase L1-like esterase